jgi:uncharacterized protein YgbK (DUF1537 family)
MPAPLLGWYGDDFTGATDTLAVLTQGGLRAMLFLGVPDARQQEAAALALGGPLDAVGIAGASRAMAPEAMGVEIEPVGRFFASHAVPVLHYKVCSTFDSAPDIGNIAAAVQTLRPHVRNAFVPIVGGQPSLGRYCVFSHLFAAAGRGGTVERIDRHPTMKDHPTTPMREADLRRHLALQGLDGVAGVHLPSYAAPAQAQQAALQALLAEDPAAVLFDVAEPSHLAAIGRLVWHHAQGDALLAVGASSVAQALIAHWRETELRDGGGAASLERPLAAANGPVFAFAGSLSPVTARQVRAAASYEPIALASGELFEEASRRQALDRVAASLRDGRHVLVRTAPDQLGAADTRRSGDWAGATARFVREVVLSQSSAGTPLRRIGIAGGDTSSLAVQALAPWGLSCAGTLGAGVTVSRVHSEAAALDGMELMLKGGQMGADDVFERLIG